MSEKFTTFVTGAPSLPVPAKSDLIPVIDGGVTKNSPVSSLLNIQPATNLEFFTPAGAGINMPHATLIMNGYFYVWGAASGGGGGKVNLNFFPDSMSDPASLRMTQICTDGTWIYGVTLPTSGVVSVYRIDPVTLASTNFFTTTNTTPGAGASIACDGSNLYVVGLSTAGNSAIEKWAINSGSPTQTWVWLLSSSFKRAHNVMVSGGPNGRFQKTDSAIGGTDVWVSAAPTSGNAWYLHFLTSDDTKSATPVSVSGVNILTDDMVTDGTYVYIPSESQASLVVIPIATPGSYSIVTTAFPMYGIDFDPVTNLLIVGYYDANATLSPLPCAIGLITAGAVNTVTGPFISPGINSINEIYLLNGIIYGTLWFDGRVIRLGSLVSVLSSQINGWLEGLNLNRGIGTTVMSSGGTVTVEPYNYFTNVNVNASAVTLAVDLTFKNPRYPTFTFVADFFVDVVNGSGGVLTVTLDATSIPLGPATLTIPAGQAATLHLFLDAYKIRAVVLSSAVG